MPQDVPAQWSIPQAEPAALVPGDPHTIGPFRIRGRIGSGGMGSVYLGTDRRGRQVAVKVIRGDQLYDGEFRARFRREVKAAAGVRSRFFANLVDADPEAELPWLATEYVPGPTLSRALAEQGPLPRAAVLTLVAGIAEALHAIHGAGLVHRDVKPSNVILGPDGPCLIDLGVVALNDATRVTMTGQPVGTPLYMAPEQAEAGRTTPAADVWSLGALAYRAATGKALFEGEHPAVVLYRVAAQEPSYDDCPDYLRPLLDACLVRDPARRPTIEAILQVSGLRELADAAAGGRAAPDAGPREGGGAREQAASAARAAWDTQAGKGLSGWPVDDLEVEPTITYRGADQGPGRPRAGRPDERHGGGNTASDAPAAATLVGRSVNDRQIERPIAHRSADQGPGRSPRDRPGRQVGAPPAPRRRASRGLVAAGAVAGVAVLAGATFGVLQLLDPDPGGAGAAEPTSGRTAGARPSPSGDPTTRAAPTATPPDGSDDNPWAQGTVKRLGEASCWKAGVDGVQGRVVTLTIACDQAGTPEYPAQTPSEWLGVYAVAADGTTRPSVPEEASATDTFWTHGDVTDPAEVTLTVTLPDLGKPLDTVAVRHKYGYGWSWAAQR
ncbi:serine/threonine-protein kinase [Myceligenerans pegani]|uniref:Protein kinase n=1 Tax=Myceligenerans pegani TaxID=2776917 RepID=A0ABR9N0V8_9MICO|nr:serine/threonine-protein kinase [Myceligenerans sp. TRM 65318]MBE1877290.1 protein kinase [Myceligenerans sp. TRM 65318]MBE3019561.1 protein kinase [Myceligenerans sp. TRM 65318]